MRMGKALTYAGKSDNFQTPIYLAQRIVKHFNPIGTILEPCCGKGNFLQVLPNADWCEISKGRDFLTLEGHWDWIITNPPYSKYRLFLNKAMAVADNIVFLQLLSHTFFRARLRDMFANKFSIKEILLLETPKEFPQFGFQLGCVYYKKNYIGDIHLCWGNEVESDIEL